MRKKNILQKTKQKCLPPKFISNLTCQAKKPTQKPKKRRISKVRKLTLTSFKSRPHQNKSGMKNSRKSFSFAFTKKNEMNRLETEEETVINQSFANIIEPWILVKGGKKPRSMNVKMLEYTSSLEDPANTLSWTSQSRRSETDMSSIGVSCQGIITSVAEKDSQTKNWTLTQSSFRMELDRNGDMLKKTNKSMTNVNDHESFLTRKKIKKKKTKKINKCCSIILKSTTKINHFKKIKNNKNSRGQTKIKIKKTKSHNPKLIEEYFSQKPKKEVPFSILKLRNGMKIERLKCYKEEDVLIFNPDKKKKLSELIINRDIDDDSPTDDDILESAISYITKKFKSKLNIQKRELNARK